MLNYLPPNQYQIIRQFKISIYTLDFLIVRTIGDQVTYIDIEVDGSSHYRRDRVDKDKDRDYFVRHSGIEPIRFPAHKVMKNISECIAKIKNFKMTSDFYLH